jgi:TolB-like protein/DNA-binding SARP family transcriptional activator
MLSLKTFGGLALLDSDESTAVRAVQRRRLALLSILATGADGGVSRDRLIGCLWPDTPADQARRFLADSLYALRRSLGQDAILARGDNLLLNPAVVRSDVGEFRLAIARGDTTAAIALYAGPFLDGFVMPDTVEFETWADGERERAAREFAAALESVVTRSEASGDMYAAVETLRRLAAHEPFSSRVALRLMHALEAGGDRAAALQHARVHEALLREALELEPDPEITNFVRQLREARPATEQPTRPAAAEQPDRLPPSDRPDRPAAVEQPAGVVPAPRRPPRRRPAFAAALVILGVVGTGAAYLYSGGRAETSAPTMAGGAVADATPGIAVLPFVDVSAEGDGEYFSDGITDELITTLAGVEGLHVVARTSAFTFKGQSLSASEIAARLKVRYVLEGSVRRSGDRLRITAQLVDAMTGFPVWTEAFDRERHDMFAVQHEIAQAIVAALRERLGDAGASPLPRRQAPAGVEAWEMYARGMYLLNAGASRDALPRAIALFEQATAAEPSYAAAHAALAEAHSLSALFGAGPPAEARARALAAARSALALDSSRAEPWAAHAGLLWVYDFEWESAERALRRAIALDPSYTGARLNLALCLQAQGRLHEALTEARAARRIDPLAPAVSTILGRIYVNARQPDEAIRYLDEALQLSPLLDVAHQQLGHAYLQKGLHAEAIAALERATEMSGGRDAAHLAYAHAVTGDTIAARRILANLLATPGPATEPFGLALAYVGLGDIDEAFRWLERGFDARAPFMHATRTTAAFQPLHSDHRWQDVLRRMNLPL